MTVVFCPICDRPPTPLPRVPAEPKPEPWYERDWFLFLLALAVIAGAILAVVDGR